MKRLMRAACGLVAVCVMAACTSGPVNFGNANAGNTNGARTNANANANATGAKGAAANLPVTLPVLDALFADESFAGELKSKLGLTDAQVEQLKQIAREEREGLSEDEEGTGSTSAASARASEKIRGVLGDEKTTQLMALVGERWGGEQTAATQKPNAVPTDTRVVVNIPAYRMDVFESGQLVKSYKVGIGYPEFPLPTGLRKADTIIFNPTWTPPDEPWVKGKFKPGQKVEAGSKDNPLGPIKIPIGAPSLIHGGKSPSRIGTFASHGCVGLTSPQVQEFAPIMAKLGGVELTPAQVAAYGQQRGQTKNLKLGSEVPVELRYETIVAEDGKLYVYRDVYDKGTNTEENLKAVLAAHGVKLEDLSEAERTQVMDALKEMARDAYGNPADGSPAPKPGKNTRETKTLKGKREVVIEVAALKGKGYPAPVNLNTGGAPQPKPAQPKAQARAQ
jgi:lipoprotein-anchoring transpeptidase ErfK/SrfK